MPVPELTGRGIMFVVRSVWAQGDLRLGIGGACLLLFLDVFFSGSYLLSLIGCPIWCLGCLLKGMEDRVGWRRIFLRMAIPAVTLGLAWAGNGVQIKVAEANSRRVIAACERFQAANGTFPRTLDELVPDQLASVPRSKYCLAYGEFLYFNHGRPMLGWYVVPPFGRRTYDFETRRWNYVE